MLSKFSVKPSRWREFSQGEREGNLTKTFSSRQTVHNIDIRESKQAILLRHVSIKVLYSPIHTLTDLSVTSPPLQSLRLQDIVVDRIGGFPSPGVAAACSLDGLERPVEG